jgi:hypothetical protein
MKLFLIILSLVALASCTKKNIEEKKALTREQKDFLLTASAQQKAYFSSCMSMDWTSSSFCMTELIEKDIK